MPLPFWMPLLVVLMTQQVQEPPPPPCDPFEAPLITVDTGAPRVALEPRHTCLDDAGALFFAYEIKNRGPEPLTVRVRIEHFTPGGLAMGRGVMSTQVRAYATERVLNPWWGRQPFPLRGRDRFVAAIVDVEGGALTWRADLEAVSELTSRAAK